MDTRLEIGMAAEAALLGLGPDLSGLHLVSRCSSGDPINEGLSGIAWFRHGFDPATGEDGGITIARDGVKTQSGCAFGPFGHFELRARPT